MRISDPWNYKAPVLITIPYLMIGFCAISFAVAIKFIFLSFVTIIGIAGYAYFLNDWADEKKDLLAGKPNAAAGMPLWARIFVLIIFFTCAVFPWFIFPYSFPNIVLLLLELLLFVLYSFPPFRFKEHPVAGIITDALYAHVIPCALAGLTFIEIGETEHHNKIRLMILVFGPILLLLALWQLFLGLRNILLHQQADEDNDRVSGIVTFATEFSTGTTAALIKICLGFEILFFVCAVATMGLAGVIIVAAYVLHMAVLIYGQAGLFSTGTSVRSFAYRFLDDFYYDWFPLAVLTWLVVYNPAFLLLAALHLLLFRSMVRPLFKKLLNALP